MQGARAQKPIKTWAAMKDERKGNYVPPSYDAHLLDRCHQFSQDNKSARKCVAKFDGLLIRCSVLGTKGKTQILSRFKLALEKT